MATRSGSTIHDLEQGVAEGGEESPSWALAELLAERLPVAALAVDAEGKIELANGAAEALLAPAGVDLRGTPLASILGTDPRLERTLAASESGALGTLDLLPLGEGEPALHLTLLPVRASRRTLVLVETRGSTEALGTPGFKPDDDATHRLAALGRLSAGVAHEIRNPLSGIGTNAQVLRRRLADGDPRLRFVTFILDEVTRLDRIITDLLRFARPPEPRLVAHDFRDSIERALALARGRIEQAGIQVRVEVAGDLPLAFVDPDQIAQVLLNVVLNAVQAMPGGGELMLAVRPVERLAPVVGRPGRRAEDHDGAGPQRKFIEVEVRDTGVGIDQADLPKLFEPFFTTRPSGTGLGLSTSQALVRQHGGAISVESELGKGTVVTILIPVEKRRGPR
jgi:signal transduction histidine kinase